MVDFYYLAGQSLKTHITMGRSLLIFVPVFLVVWAASSFSQEPPPPEKADSTGGLIDTVEIIRENVFDLTVPQYNNFLFKLANKTHVITRSSVIERELLLHTGEPFDTARANESIRNLRRLPFLLKTDIYMRKNDSGKNVMVVNTSDRWTTIGGVSYRRVGGRYDYDFNLEESNFLGHGLFTSHDYVIPDQDRRYYEGQVSGDHFPFRGISTQVEYSDDPKAGRVVLTLSRPLFVLSQKWGGQVTYMTARDRLDYYDRSSLVAQDHDHRKRIYLNSTFRLGPEHIKYYLVGEYSYTDLAATGRTIYADQVAGPHGEMMAIDSILPPRPTDSLIHFFTGTFQVQQINYAVYQRLNRFIKPEDVNLGWDAYASFGVGYDPSSRVNRFYYGAVRPQYTLGTRSLFSIMGLKYERWFKGGTSYRQSLNYYFKWYWLYAKSQTLAMRAQYQFDKLRSIRYTLYLDEDGGIRGYRLYSYSGENRLVINLENRIFSNIEIMTVGIGGVVFADIGNIWDRAHKVSIRDSRTSLGAGIRFGISRSTRHEIVRVDLAYAVDAAGWEISVGTGQYF